VVRQFLSKSIAGGLSAGVVLLWWPVLFDEVDTVTSWLVRGVAWTVCFELLMFALVPFERALWETARGERLSSRVVGAANSRLHAGSRRRRLSRLSAVATVALAVPIALMVMGLQEQTFAKAEAAPVRPINVVRVTKVVKVKKVVEQAAASAQPVATAAAPQAPGPAPSRESGASKPDQVVVGRAAPVSRQDAPKTGAEVTDGSGETCVGDACGSSAAPAPAPSF
jgi:hypothetical protein